MPTKISASGSIVRYSNKSWGGIDIFTRVQTKDRLWHPCIIELKDENTESEPARKVIKQALAYTVFIRELLRDTNAGADEWWKLFNMGRPLPRLNESLELFAVCMMPKPMGEDTDIDTSFGGERVEIDGDAVHLHYIYYSENEPNVISDEYESSLHLL